MKQSGINYFYSGIGLPTGILQVFYTFEEGAGSVTNSISLGQPQFSGIIGQPNNFWIIPGTGNSSGANIQIQNASGLYSSTWTQIFVYEKTNTNACVLFSSLGGGSGYNIGINDANKPYLETNNGIYPILGSSSNNYSSKNAVSFSYAPNFLTIGYYNFCSQQIEPEFFNYNFNITRSNNCYLYPSYTGYVDYFLYFNQYLDANILNQLLSGLYATPNGSTASSSITNFYFTGITGYQQVNFIQTGITGYQQIITSGSGYAGYGFVFPTTTTTVPLTGIVSSGFYNSGVTGVTLTVITGNSTELYNYNTGYINSFGMEKIEILDVIQNNYILKDSYSFDLFDDNYNIYGSPQYSGFYFNNTYNSGVTNLYYNGVAQANNGWFWSGNFIFLTGSTSSDYIFFDVASGTKNVFLVTGINSFPFAYIGQEIYLNGVNLVSGYDFTYTGGNIILTNLNTGISGYIFEYPIVKIEHTGNYTVKTGIRFDRDSSMVYINGVRQGINLDYQEGAIYDMLSGNYYNNTEIIEIYNDNNLYWS